MQQYRIEFFDRSMTYVHHDFSVDLSIDDDYIAIQTTTIEIGATDKVEMGQFIRILRDEQDYFFGVVSEVSPGEYMTQVTFKPFVSVFDEDILFDTTYQSVNSVNKSLENTLKKYISETYINNSDALQNLPLTITVPSSSANHTFPWGMNLKSDTEGMNRAIIGLYGVLIVNALKKYGVAISVTPNFTTKKINLNISKVDDGMVVDADLDNVTVKTLKVNDRPNGVNKLTVYNTQDYSQSITFYVHASNRDWDSDNTDRIYPVVRDIKATEPDSEVDPSIAFEWAAINVGYDELNGLEWDNLIELECAPNDPLINPTLLRIGQKITMHYKGGTYTSLLTGKNITLELITLVFGSERISYTKRKASK